MYNKPEFFMVSHLLKTLNYLIKNALRISPRNASTRFLSNKSGVFIN